MVMQNVYRAVAWLLLSVIVVLTLVPPGLRPTTFIPHKMEHAGIFLTVGISFGTAYLGREWLLSIGAILFCAAVELVQLYVPARHARLSDFVVDAIAGLIGVFVGPILVRNYLAFR
jgi:VanZ family protein